jgi:predicted lipid-binding transport protein (Tim44 family)
MKHLIVSLFAMILTLGLGVADAEAKRLGGGGSFGMQRQMTPQQAPRAPAAAPQQSGTTAGAQPRRSWMGPIAGLAAGLGLAALFSHLGMGEELGSFVMIALLVGAAFMLFRMLSRRSAPAQATGPMQYAGATPMRGAAAPATDFPMSAAGGQTGTPSALPADFDAEAFVRQAKLHFIRLQAANDSGNLEDIREFTTPEVFAEIRLQLTERGATEQRTDVVELNGEVIEVAEEGDRYIVSVRFNGLLREDADSAPTAFDEVWHLAKPAHGSEGWRVAGIQQVA